jgi:hypothetical protein
MESSHEEFKDNISQNDVFQMNFYPFTYLIARNRSTYALKRTRFMQLSEIREGANGKAWVENISFDGCVKRMRYTDYKTYKCKSSFSGWGFLPVDFASILQSVAVRQNQFIKCWIGDEHGF